MKAGTVKIRASVPGSTHEALAASRDAGFVAPRIPAGGGRAGRQFQHARSMLHRRTRSSKVARSDRRTINSIRGSPSAPTEA